MLKKILLIFLCSILILSCQSTTKLSNMPYNVESINQDLSIALMSHSVRIGKYQNEEMIGGGSGVCISRMHNNEGWFYLILTAAHVIDIQPSFGPFHLYPQDIFETNYRVTFFPTLPPVGGFLPLSGINQYSITPTFQSLSTLKFP